MRLPVPTGREVRGAFYVLALCALALTVTLCWAIVHKINQSDDIVHIASASADTVKRLNDKVDALNAEADAARVQASAERDALRRQNRQLIKYLREHGLSVPELHPSADESPPPKQQTPSGASPKPKPRTPSPRPTPTPPASPTPDDPGLLCNLAPLLCP